MRFHSTNPLAALIDKREQTLAAMIDSSLIQLSRDQDS